MGYVNSVTFNLNSATVSATGSEFALVSTQDHTTVTITPAQKTGNRPGRVPYQITLNQGQTYQLENTDITTSNGSVNGDLTGSVITSDKPIAVTSGHRNLFVPAATLFSNKVEEELPPTSLWGQNFATLPFATRNTRGDRFRYVAAHDQTHIQVNGVPVATLNRGEFFEQVLGAPSMIAADQPILVGQFSQGGSVDGVFDNGSNSFQTIPGDPTLVLVQPYDQFGGSYTVSTPPTGFSTNLLNVVAPTAGINVDGAIQLDGVALPAASFTAIGNSGFSGAQVPVSVGSHHVASTALAFGLTAYGFDRADAYGYYGGACYAREAAGTQIALTPKTLSSQIDVQNCAQVTATEASGQALGGFGVHLAVTGVNPQTAFLHTDATGTAQFCYTGTNPGSDLITVTAGHLSDTASWTWTAATSNHAPIVNAGQDQTIFLPQNVITLHGSVVDDGLPVGAQLSIQWTSLSPGMPPVIFSNATSPITQVQVSTAATGTYTFQLSADDMQFVSTAIVHVTVNAANQPPVVSAGPAQTLYATLNGLNVPQPRTGNLQGTATDDGLPKGSLALQWSTFSGPAAVTFANPASAATAATFPLPGVYVLALTANDSQLSTTSLVQVTVLVNQPPVVVMPAPQTLISSGPVTATLNAQVTDDGLPLGSSLSIQWQLHQSGVTLANPNRAVTTLQLPGPGNYFFSLNASDGMLTTSGDAFITVQATPLPPPPTPPVVTLISPLDQADIHSPVPVVGSVSTGNWTLAYRLNNDEGAATTPFITLATGTGAVANATLATFDPARLLNGVYTLQLSSTDTSGQTRSTSIDVTVSRNFKLGFFTVSFNDLTVPLPGLAVQVVRTYDSRNQGQGDFGFGWTLSLGNVRLQKNRPFTSFWEETVSTGTLIPQYCVQSDSNKSVTITFPDGKVYKFTASLSPQCQLAGPITAPTLSFTQVPGEAGTEGATLSTADGVMPLIDGGVPGTFNLVQQDGSLYNPTLFNLATAEGFTYIIDQKLGLQSVTDPNGNTLTITPNGITHSAGKSLVFQRDDQGRIASIIDPQGNTLYYGYDPLRGDFQSFTDAQGNTTFYQYSPNNVPHLLETITDPRGLPVLQNVWGGPAGDQLQQSVDALRNPITYNVQEATNQETITDRSGNKTTYSYDNDGNVTAMVDALGHPSSYTYDVAGNKLTETHQDDSGRQLITHFGYDAQSNLTSQTDPLGNLTRYFYDTHRHVTQVIDARGKVTNNNYDNQGNLLTTQDPLGNVTTYTYFSNGLPKTVKDAAGGVTSFDYDGNGNLLHQTDALGNVTTFTYDNNNNKLTQSVKRTRADGTKETLTTSYFYDQLNRVVKTVNPDKSFTLVSYNSMGKQATTTDANGNVTAYDYDQNGRLSTVTYADQTKDNFTYDNNGNRLTSTSHGQLFTAYQYDPLNRLVLTQYTDGGTVATVYDALGRVQSTTDQRLNTTTYGYDDAGRRTTVTQPCSTVAPGCVPPVSHYGYDEAGNQISFVDANQNPTTYVYDDAGRRIQTIYADKTFEKIDYDALGRQVARTDQAGKLTQYGYDALGCLTSVTQSPDGGITQLVTTYAYDELGNRISQTDANGNTTKFAYDQLGRRSGRTLPAGQNESYGYDAAGNMTARADFNGHVTTYTYDKMNRLTQKTADAFFSTGACASTQAGPLPCGATQVSYTYTATGKRATMTDGLGQWQYGYDARDRLTRKSHATLNNQGLNWDYDKAGNLLDLGTADGLQNTYSYDALNRLVGVNNAFEGEPVMYSYDAVGNLSGMRVGPLSTSYSYDTLVHVSGHRRRKRSEREPKV